MSGRRPALATLTKEEAIEELEEVWGEVPHPQWTSAEIKSRLKELRQAEEPKDEKTGDGRSLKGMTRMTKGELTDLCDSFKVSVTVNDTKATMMRKVRDAEFLQRSIRPTDLKSFGKHAAMTYEEVQQQQPSNCQWARSAAADGECSPQLAIFVRYLTDPGTRKVPTKEKKGQKAKPQRMPATKMTSAASSSAGRGEHITAAIHSQSQPRWQALVATKRLVCMEMCCSPASVISQEVNRRTAPGQAVRAAAWNGCDLAEEKGPRKH